MLHSMKSGFLFGGAGLFQRGGVQGVELAAIATFVHTNRGFRRQLCRFIWTKIVIGGRGDGGSVQGRGDLAPVR